MSNFSGSFRRFKEGLQWNLLREYWVTIRENAWETLWGTTILGIAFVFYTLYRAPSLQFLGWVIAWIVLVAGYNAWRPYGTANPMVFLDIYDDGQHFWVVREYYWDSLVEMRQKTDAEYAAISFNLSGREAMPK